ncbi:MAG: RsbRD N-terminal domain-containing protein [Deltaproteobacteria bacterium]|nr:RsbRD N-terminal domain-containing protein [Deltaproteobacteria bacterium]MDL1960409.1 RsbRD N-terminal domain-containing protein [Deltaproteobacteria bacterium]
MNLEKFLTKKRDHVVDKWIQSVQETYPAETVKFFRHQRNRFANPLGAAISETMGPLFDELLNENNPQNISSLLDRIIRIRAVQEFEPSSAVAVVFLLKKVIRDELKKDIEKDGLIKVEDLLEFESRIDYCALLAFDVYMKCRETIWGNKLDDFIKRPYVTGGNMRCLSYMLKQEQRQGKVAEDCCNNCGLGEVR